MHERSKEMSVSVIANRPSVGHVRAMITQQR